MTWNVFNGRDNTTADIEASSDIEAVAQFIADTTDLASNYNDQEFEDTLAYIVVSEKEEVQA